MDYQLLDHDTEVRAERAKHVAFGHQRADYDRITVIVADDKLHVRGETVAVSGGSPVPMHGAVESRSAGGATATWTSKELRADVQRTAAECGGSRRPAEAGRYIVRPRRRTSG